MYTTFRDKRGKAWQRDTHGRLTGVQRNVDNAPPADPVSGRISYGMRNQAAGPASSAAATEEEVERLREAESARQHAAKERGVSNQLSNDRSRQRQTPADEGERHAAVQSEDPKA